jgi:hypothetical protein
MRKPFIHTGYAKLFAAAVDNALVALPNGRFIGFHLTPTFRSRGIRLPLSYLFRAAFAEVVSAKPVAALVVSAI